MINDETRYDENTLTKVYDALKSVGLPQPKCVEAVNAMHNKGILFRERRP